MAPRPAATPSPLTDADVGTLQERIAGGELPKVALLRDSAVGPAGTPGVVVTVSQPATGECLLVRVKGDELPYAPDELSWPVRRPRGRPRKEAPAAAPASEVASEVASKATPKATPETATEAKVATSEVAGAEAATAPAPPPPAPAKKAGTAAPRAAARAAARVAEQGPPPAPAQEPAAPVQPPQPAQPARSARPAKRRAAGGPAPFSVSLRFTGNGWTSESSRGGKRSKARPVSLAAMRALATRMDDVELRTAILGSLDACRQRVEERAQALRAQLEQAEIALAELEEDD